MSEDIPCCNNDAHSILLKDHEVIAQLLISKSAPTSANGSLNLCPVLDIQVKLPLSDESDSVQDGEEDE